jgi:hypothetical protein
MQWAQCAQARPLNWTAYSQLHALCGPAMSPIAEMGRHMDRKSCKQCARPADFSPAFLVSTIGVRPRGQKCTLTVPFCKHCIRSAAPFLASTPFQDLEEPLREAYTSLEGGSTPSPECACAFPSAAEAHQGGDAVVSCRLCLIACNSRHGDEVGYGHDR